MAASNRAATIFVDSTGSGSSGCRIPPTTDPCIIRPS
jgi:hypothetical protein